jgi:hypothetical protein
LLHPLSLASVALRWFQLTASHAVEVVAAVAPVALALAMLELLMRALVVSAFVVRP